MAATDTVQSEEDREFEREHWVKQELARCLERFRGRDQLALLDCVVLCDEENYPIPRWARCASAMMAQRYLCGLSATLDDALFGAKKSPGRHSKAATKRRKEAQHQLWFDIISAHKANGLKGDAMWDVVLEDVKRHGLPRGVAPPPVPKLETLTKTYQKMKRSGAKPSLQFLLFRNVNGIFDTGDAA
jgi:hypothetical protein